MENKEIINHFSHQDTKAQSIKQVEVEVKVETEKSLSLPVPLPYFFSVSPCLCGKFL